MKSPDSVCRFFFCRNQNRKVEVVALIDSGNRLYLPQVEETKKNAVSLIDDEIANQLFGTEIGNYLKNHHQLD